MMPRRHITQKSNYKAVLAELDKIEEADRPNKAKAEKKTVESLFLKVEIGNFKKKMTAKAQVVFQLYTNLHRRGTSALGCHHQGADGVFDVHKHFWSWAKEVTMQDDQVISNVPASPPAAVFLMWCRWKIDILYLKLP